MVRLKGRNREVVLSIKLLKEQYGSKTKFTEIEADLRSGMKMLVCEDCGRTYSEDSLVYFTERHGLSAAETRGEKFSYYRCDCGGELEEATRCSVCGDWANKYGVCRFCLDNNESLDTAIDIGEKNKDEVSINGYVAFALTEDEINSILIEHLKKSHDRSSKKIKEYCEEDMWYFSGYLEKKAKEQTNG